MQWEQNLMLCNKIKQRSLVLPYPHMNILPNKWVFKIERKVDRSIEIYKAQLVANGFHQQEGIDYSETFSPVVKHSTIYTSIALVVHHDWLIRQLDVQNAFLYGFLSEDVYMRQLTGFGDPNFMQASQVFRWFKTSTVGLV